MSRVYLLDANALGAWCHFAGSDHSDHHDMIEGVQNWWESFTVNYQPTKVIAALDCSRADNWRKKLYTGYKSARDSKPPDQALRDGFARLPEALADLGIEVARADECEADDVIATLSDTVLDVVIVTTDKDLHQLVDDRVSVYDPRPDPQGVCKFYDTVAVYQKHHVNPMRLRELLAIMGDSADSVPGVKGWGKVAAVTAINQTASRMELLRRVAKCELKDITEKKQRTFNVEEFDLAYRLVGLRFDADVKFNTKEI